MHIVYAVVVCKDLSLFLNSFKHLSIISVSLDKIEQCKAFNITSSWLYEGKSLKQFAVLIMLKNSKSYRYSSDSVCLCLLEQWSFTDNSINNLVSLHSKVNISQNAKIKIEKWNDLL